jgi:hypothetical protein
MTRITENIGQPCSEEFIWKLDISEDVGEKHIVRMMPNKAAAHRR